MSPPADEDYDDFVLTISDGDLQSSGSDSAPEVEEQPEASKKRKRTTIDKASSKRARQDGGSSEATIKTRDDAFDPDFEFDLGVDVANNVEDFDGWGDAETESHGRGQRTVDIDEIIARRVASKGNSGLVNASDTEEEGSDGKDEGDIEALAGKEVDTEQDGSEIPEFEDEELLADDAFGGKAGIGHDQMLGEEQDADGPVSDNDDDSVATPTGHPDDSASESDDDTSSQTSRSSTNSVEIAKRAAFFTAEEKPPHGISNENSTTTTFLQLNLSRPLLRALTTLTYSQPTPIQARAVPIALQGLDIVGSAKTGSGKTAAFLLPILERLLYRPSKIPITRVAILMPTRELAVQCYNVATALARYTDITVAQVVGGFSLREQEVVLKKRPDIVIATPGRFIDHMRNSASFQVESIEILVLDEADRMLEDGFADELDEILKTIPRGRQTMLFSATMTESVDKLIRVGMDKPVRINVDAKKSTVEGLIQEFVRLRPGREKHRLATLCLLCKDVFTKRTIVFFRQKKEAHRVRIVFGLLGIKSGELHGSMSQEQRIAAVNAFRDGKTTHLLATDLASRGLDIKNVMSVINYEAPQSHEIYLHRVGRTARAGRSGRSCTIAAESDRKVVKAAVKAARLLGAKITSRTIDTKEVDAMSDQIDSFANEIEEILVEEKEEKVLAQTATQIRRGENLVKHEAEIMSRPKRTWFESEKEKQVAREKGRAELNFVGEKKKLSNKQKKRLDDTRDRVEGRTFKKRKDSESKVKAMKQDQRRSKKDKAKTKSRKAKK